METTQLIQKAQAADNQSVKALLELHHLPFHDLPPALHHFLVAREDGELAGTIGLELYRKYALVRSLAVQPGKQGKGLGKILYLALQEMALKENVEELFLLTTTAAGFFQQMGFHFIERSEVPELIRRSGQFAGICPATATAMHKSLLH